MKKTLLLFPQLLLAFLASAQFALPLDVVDPVGPTRYAIAMDVDGDGDNDVICATEERLFWLPQTSPGVFGRQILISEDDIDYDILAAADVDGDGDSDFFYCDYTGVFALHRNDGNGQFGAREIIFDGPEIAWSIHVADVDGDGDPDLLGTLKNEVLWFANDGNGVFGPKQTISTDHQNLFAVYAEDLDGDGDQDVLAASRTDGKLGWYENLGGGTFGPQQLVAPAFNDARTVATGDLDGDGLPDVLCNNALSSGGEVLWMRNLGNGSFATPQLVSDIGEPSFVTVADMDGDTDLDVIFCHTLSDISWVENDGSGQFGAPNELANEIVYAYYVQTDDLNGDGLPDPMFWTSFASTNHETLLWRPSQGNGNFAQPQLLAIGMKESLSCLVADFDQDGFDDLAIPSLVSDAIVWYRNEGGAFSPPKLVARQYNFSPRYMAVEDMNGDGFPDIVAESTITPTGHTYVGWYANNGDGSFTAQTSVIGGGAFMQDLKTGDVDNDGDPDILWVYSESSQNANGSLHWIENLGNGVLADSKTIADGLVAPVSVSLIRFSPDEPPFLFLTKKAPQPIQYFHYVNDTNFDTYNLTSDFSHAVWSEALDVNQDGLDDLVATDYGFPDNHKIALWINNGTGFFEPQLTLNTGSIQWAVPTLADVNLDGLPDIVVGSRSSSVYWFQGLGGGNFATSQAIPNSLEGAQRVRLTDLDHDGDLDLIALRNDYWANVSETGDKLSFAFNLANNESMSGRVFFDENENGTLDAGESFAGRFPIEVTPSALAVFTDDSGMFNIYAGAGTYTITPDLGECWELTTQPDAHIVDFDGLNPLTGFDFGVKTNNALTSGSISMTSSATRCGFTVPFWLNFSNTGCNPANGRAALLQHPLATFLSADLAPDATSGDTLFWDFDSLLPGENRQVKMEFEIAGVQFLGETIEMPLLIQDGNAQTIASYQYQSVINCAYDPNDKQVYPRRTEQPPFDANYTLFDERIEYTIRFQNTGTDTAFNIVIRDTLSSDLDLATFRPGSTSHPFEATLHDDGLLEFHFRDIMLPDSNINEPGSHGYVNFTIIAKAGLAENTVIENYVGIYFDFNPPIVTNTVSSILVEMLPNFTPTAAFDFTLTDWTAQFNDLSTNTPTSWLWDFGDGSTSAEQHPVHTYAAVGDYTVCLTVANDWGSHQSCQPLMVLTSTWEQVKDSEVIVYPNPALDEIWIEKTTDQTISVALSGLMGQTMGVYVLSEKTTRINISELPAGVWLLRTTGGATAKVVKL
ncbi:MAG: FG-GAP-like repeat-containing protein [Saprospiraceae bacterium]